MLRKLTDANNALKIKMQNDWEACEIVCKNYLTHLLKEFPSDAIDKFKADKEARLENMYLVYGFAYFNTYYIDPVKILADSLEDFTGDDQSLLRKLQIVIHLINLMQAKGESIVYKILSIHKFIEQPTVAKTLSESRGIFVKPKNERKGVLFINQVKKKIKSMGDILCEWRDKDDVDVSLYNGIIKKNYLNNVENTPSYKNHLTARWGDQIAASASTEENAPAEENSMYSSRAIS